jgi:hypothetical protein
MVRLLEALNRASPFFSFIVGLGLSVVLFHRNYTSTQTLAIPIQTATDRIVKAEGKCWRYRVEDASCESSR